MEKTKLRPRKTEKPRKFDVPTVKKTVVERVVLGEMQTFARYAADFDLKCDYFFSSREERQTRLISFRTVYAPTKTVYDVVTTVENEYDYRKEIPLYRSKAEMRRAYKGHKARLAREGKESYILPTVTDYCNVHGETVILSESASRRIAERQEKNCNIDRDAIMSAAERAAFIKEKALYLMQKHPGISKRKAKDAASAMLDQYIAEQMDNVRQEKRQKANDEKARFIAQLPVVNGITQCPDYNGGRFAKKRTVAQKQRSKAKSSKDTRNAMERGEKPAQKTTEQHLKDAQAKLHKAKKMLESCITSETKSAVKRLEREVQLWQERFTMEQKEKEQEQKTFIRIKRKNAN